MWQGTNTLTLHIPSQKEVLFKNNSATLIKEPLVYSLRIGERWQRIHEDRPERALPHSDWEVYPTTDWNYALRLSQNMDECFQFTYHPMSKIPFSPDGAPITVTAQGQHINQWRESEGNANEIPSLKKMLQTRIEDITLIPYGCTNLRITEFPFIRIV
jgi:hypothetical protein